jgi:hypothetical protein
MTIDTSRLTVEQRRNLRRWSRFPSTMWVSQAKLKAHLDRYLAEAERREQEAAAQAVVDSQRGYFATISRVIAYTGPDYRIQFPGQSEPRVRATKHMWEHAGVNGIPRAIWEPDTQPVPA